MPFIHKILLWFAFFLTIGSGCFQLDGVLPIAKPALSFASKLIFAVGFFFHIFICLKLNKPLVTRYDLFLLVFFACLIVSSYMSGHSWISHLPFIIKTFAIRFLLSFSFVYDKSDIIKTLSSAFSSIIYANFFFLLFLPGFLGYAEYGPIYLISTNYNQFGAVFIPAIFIKTMTLLYENKKLLGLYPLLITCLLSVILVGSATSSVALSILLFTVIFFRKPQLIKLESLTILIGILLFFITFVVPLFSFLDIPVINQIVENLGKDMTFSKRTYIWIICNRYIISNPIWGYGVCDEEWYDFLLSNARNPHNIILHVFMHGGLVAFIVFSIFVIGGIKSIRSILNPFHRNILLFISVIFLLMSQFEVYNNMFIYVYILLMYIAKDYQNHSLHAECKHNARLALG